ncbi:auxin-responsive protein IAA10 isoform X2 [Cryptomeria japonica]|uniref:auxin-responsive protein IAA10 isoform X2 n=1 Tax=Cryptomeria japonica TaxID=3369 RepID=UPI0025ACCA1C|nr:auxin-responsive protein IAA10 isoform X2 [Cryptomeria japonica]
MSTHDYIAHLSAYSDSDHAHAEHQFEETDLRLSLGLPVADLFNNERNWGKAECMRRFGLQGSSEEAQDSSRYSNDFSSLNEAVGWPPVQTCRKNMVCKPLHSENQRGVQESMNGNSEESGGSSNFLKVIMDGMPIGRKVDLNAYNSYNSLALALEHIFQPSFIYAVKGSSIAKDSKSSWLLEASSSYLLTYQDKHGNWMFVGDAPWQVFVKSVKRLRIAKGKPS